METPSGPRKIRKRRQTWKIKTKKAGKSRNTNCNYSRPPGGANQKNGTNTEGIVQQRKVDLSLPQKDAYPVPISSKFCLPYPIRPPVSRKYALEPEKEKGVNDVIDIADDEDEAALSKFELVDLAEGDSNDYNDNISTSRALTKSPESGYVSSPFASPGGWSSRFNFPIIRPVPVHLPPRSALKFLHQYFLKTGTGEIH